MIAKTLVFVCAAFGLVAGSCFEIKVPQDSCPQYISLPIQESSDNSFSDNSSPLVATPVVSENLFSGSSCGSSSSLSSSSSSPVFSVVSAPVVTDNVFSSGNSLSEIFSSGSSSASSGAEATNGPDATPINFVQAPAVTLPAIEGPLVTLSAPAIPAPRVLSQRCICTKTIVKPQVIQRTVTVPRLQRYLKRTVTPVVENVAYKSTPITQGSSSGNGAIVIPGSSSSSCASSSSIPVVFNSESGSQSRYVSAPVVVSSGCSSRLY